MIQIIIWAILVTSFTLIGSWYARKYNKADALIALYTSFIIFSNIAAVKIAEFNLLQNFYAPAAVIIFSVTFLLTDIVNEKFGRKETHKMIFIAFFAQIAVTLFTFLAISLKPAPFWPNQNAFELLLGQVPRIIFASWVAFLVSENLDAVIFDWFKKLTKGKHLWMRNVLSSVPAMLVDSVLFVSIAFFGTISFAQLLSLIIGQVVIKWLVAAVNIPFMYANRYILYKK